MSIVSDKLCTDGIRLFAFKLWYTDTNISSQPKENANQISCFLSQHSTDQPYHEGSKLFNAISCFMTSVCLVWCKTTRIKMLPSSVCGLLLWTSVWGWRFMFNNEHEFNIPDDLTINESWEWQAKATCN